MDDALIAFIGWRISPARTDIRHEFKDVEFEANGGGTRGTILIDGKRQPFRIVTREEDLRGMRLTEFRVLPSGWSHRASDIQKLMDIARASIIATGADNE